MKALLFLAGFVFVAIVVAVLAIKYVPVIFSPMLRDESSYSQERGDASGEGINRADDLLRDVGDTAGYL